MSRGPRSQKAKRRRNLRTRLKKNPALGIASALQKLRNLPEGALSAREQVILRRIDEIQRGILSGTLKKTDFVNIKKIADRLRIKL